MHLREVVARRRMVRSFDGRPIEPEVVDRLCDLARRAPSAGNSQGVDLLVLEGSGAEGYWNLTLPPDRRARFRWPGLLRAPVLVVVVVSPDRYVARYAEPDKAGTGLGDSDEAWPVPYWHVDAGMAVMALLLGAVDAGLGAAFIGLFDKEQAVRERFGVPVGRRAVGTVAIGYPDGLDEPGRSATRPRRPRDEVVHRGAW